MIRKKKLYARPKKLYQKERIKEENVLLQKYALKSKREIWKTLAKINYYRSRAKVLAKAPLEEQQVLFAKLNKLGLNIKTIADVLALKIEDLLNRRLTTVLVNKKLSRTSRHARQLVAHKKLSIRNKVINIPSYLVSVEEEAFITVSQPIVKVEKKESAPVSVPENKGGESQ